VHINKKKKGELYTPIKAVFLRAIWGNGPRLLFTRRRI